MFSRPGEWLLASSLSLLLPGCDFVKVVTLFPVELCRLQDVVFCLLGLNVAFYLFIS